MRNARRNHNASPFKYHYTCILQSVNPDQRTYQYHQRFCLHNKARLLREAQRLICTQGRLTFCFLYVGDRMPVAYFCSSTGSTICAYFSSSSGVLV